MNDIQMEKVKQALSRMDDDFWEFATYTAARLTVLSTEILDEFSSTYIKLLVAQINIVSTKYDGYQRFIDCTDEAGRAEIAEESRDDINNLVQEKNQCLITLAELLAKLHVLIN